MVYPSGCDHEILMKKKNKFSALSITYNIYCSVYKQQFSVLASLKCYFVLKYFPSKQFVYEPQNWIKECCKGRAQVTQT